jgi:hypothetical protein
VAFRAAPVMIAPFGSNAPIPGRTRFTGSLMSTCPN